MWPAQESDGTPIRSCGGTPIRGVEPAPTPAHRDRATGRPVSRPVGTGSDLLDTAYMKPARWSDPDLKLFPHQVGFTAPPMDFDAAPTDFLRIAPETVGVHGRLLHLPGYAHELTQRADNLHLLEEVAECMSNSGADAVGQVGTNWATPAELMPAPSGTSAPR